MFTVRERIASTVPANITTPQTIMQHVFFRFYKQMGVFQNRPQFTPMHQCQGGATLQVGLLAQIGLLMSLCYKKSYHQWVSDAFRLLYSYSRIQRVTLCMTIVWPSWRLNPETYSWKLMGSGGKSVLRHDSSLILPTGLMHSFIFMFYEINGRAWHRLSWLQMLCESIYKRGTAVSERLRFTSESSTWHELIPKQEVNDVALPIPHFLSLHFFLGVDATHTETHCKAHDRHTNTHTLSNS